MPELPAQALAYRGDARSYFLDQLGQSFFAHAQLLGPITQLPFLMHIDARTILRARTLKIICHVALLLKSVAMSHRMPGRGEWLSSLSHVNAALHTRIDIAHGGIENLANLLN
jgi:hypothetical protein